VVEEDISGPGGSQRKPPDDGPPPNIPNEPAWGAIENTFDRLFRIPDEGPGLFAAAIQAVERFAFPLALTVLVVAYLLGQYWMDRKEPKLAIAPVNARYDRVRFE